MTFPNQSATGTSEGLVTEEAKHDQNCIQRVHRRSQSPNDGRFLPTLNEKYLLFQ